MLHPGDIGGVRPVATLDAPKAIKQLGDAREALYNRLDQIAVGKTTVAVVLSRLDDGTFLLKIADTAVRVSLPMDAQVGDQIALKLMTSEPRPTFLLMPAAVPVPANSTPTSLSSTAQLIATVLQDAQQDGAPTALVGKSPVVASALASTPQVAAGLQNLLNYSGVFYESHLRQWAGGERSLAELMREPQAQSGAAVPGSAAADAAALNAKLSTTTSELTKLIDIVTKWELGKQTSQLDNATVRNAAQSDALPERLDAESAQRINLQLNTLEHNRIAWRGELWPGQKLEWDVSEDTPNPNPDAETPKQSSWTSVVRFELPLLGVISASIHLDGEHVRMQVRTSSDAAAAKLREQGHSLALALDAAGSPLDLLTVKKDEEA